MSSTTTSDRAALIDEALAQPTFCHAFQLTAAAYADEPALLLDDGSTAFTWTQYAERVRALAGGLASLGLERDACVGLLLDNRVEFAPVDLAAMHLGATPFSIYHTNPPSQIVPLLANSEAEIVITQQSYLERILETKERHPGLKTIVVVDGEGDPGNGVVTLDSIAADAPDGFDFDATWKAVDPDTVVTLVYTSGTTGEPKGVQHTHATIMASAQSMHLACPFSPGGRVVSYLPNAHIAERFISHYSSMVFGLSVTFCPDPKKLPQVLGQTQPTRLFGVPRIYEKLMGGAQAMAAKDDGLAYAIDQGKTRAVAIAGGCPPEHVALSPREEERLADLRQKLGVGQAEFVGVAAAPSPESMLEFFPAIGVHLVEFWGASECIFTIVPPWDKPKIGTVGTGAPNVEIELAEDGEILVRGPNVMIGYRKDPEQTAEAINADGWYHTGDIAERDRDGYLKIVDRKKEIIINSAGKNMSPTKIELALSQQSPLIAQVVAIGDRRPFVGALVVLDPEQCEARGVDVAAAADSDEVRQEVADAVEKANVELARVEQIRAHTILHEAFSPGSDVLTPTQKLKRKPIAEKFADEIESLYAS